MMVDMADRGGGGEGGGGGAAGGGAARGGAARGGVEGPRNPVKTRNVIGVELSLENSTISLKKIET